MKNTGEARGQMSEIQKATELVKNETFRALVDTGVKAHIAFLQKLGTDSGAEGMRPNVESALADLETLGRLITEDLVVYKITHTLLGAVYISAAPIDVVEGDRLFLDQEQNGTAHQINIRLTHPGGSADRGDYLSISAEQAAIRKSYQPVVTVSVIPETLTLTNRGVDFSSGPGITADFYDSGYVEVFGSTGVGRREYVSREPLTVLEDRSVARLLEKLEQ